jgi:hypothetical protein
LLDRNQAFYRAGKALLKSVKHNSIPGIKKALATGALFTVTDKQGQGPLHRAALYGHIESVEYLLGNQPIGSCPVNILNRQGMTTLYVACANGQWRIVDYLLAQGADVNAVDHQGRTIMHHAIEQDDEVTVTYLFTQASLKNKVNLNQQDKKGRAPLHYAVYTENKSISLLLLQYGANSLIKDKQGDLPLDLAYRCGNPSIIAFLKNKQTSRAILPLYSEENWVIVRIWKRQEIMSLGHVSLQTPHLYASFWPENYSLTDGIKSVRGVNADTPEGDIQREGYRKPDVTIVLYSLDLQKIKEMFQAFLNGEKLWALKGRNKFAPDAQSCSGLVYDLLIAGGIKQLVGVNWLMSHVVTTPMEIAKLAQQAKQAELEKYPDTLHFVPPLVDPTQKPIDIKQEDYDALLKKMLLEFRAEIKKDIEQRFEEQQRLHQAQRESDDLRWEVERSKQKEKLNEQAMSMEMRFVQLRQGVAIPSAFFPPLPAALPQLNNLGEKEKDKEKESEVHLQAN